MLSRNWLHSELRFTLKNFVFLWALLYCVGQLLWPRYAAEVDLRLLNLPRFYSHQQAFELAQANLKGIRSKVGSLQRLEITPSNLGMSLKVYSDTPRRALINCRKFLDQFLLEQADQTAHFAKSCRENHVSQRSHLIDLLTSREKEINQLSPEETRRYLLSILDYRELAYRQSAQQRKLEMQLPLWVILDGPNALGRDWRPRWLSFLVALLSSLCWSAALKVYRRSSYQDQGLDLTDSGRDQRINA